MKTSIKSLSLFAAFGAFALASTPAAAQGRASPENPAAYCRAMGNVDEPGARAGGPGAPDWIRRRLALRPDQSAGVAWRCMNRHVLACVDGGASAHCSRADTSRAVTREMRTFCAASPGLAIPTAVAGSETIFAWGCAGRSPRIVRQWARLDQRGFARPMWRDLTPRAR